MNADPINALDTPLEDGLPPADLCRRARLSRDPRFDGEFYIAVRTTGIYCRPVCPARPPAEHNVHYFRSAAQAALAGYRPCLRCRPESAPNSPAWNGTSTTVRRALRLIEEGALNDGDLPALSERLGIGERYLRKLFERELGVSPLAVATNQRLLFARKLLAETRLPVTAVAFAAGFGSVRRFNSAVRSGLRSTPSALRRQTRSQPAGAVIRLQLHYRPPYDWEGVRDFFARHAIDGIESVDGDSYRRELSGDGWVHIRPAARRDTLELLMQLPDQRQLMPTVARVRRMFDLDANPAAIAAVLRADPRLRRLHRKIPGIRAPGYACTFEAAVRAVVGQQISTQAARTVLSRLAAACAPAGAGAFPDAAALAALDESQLPLPTQRRQTLRALCQRALQTEVRNELRSEVRGEVTSEGRGESQLELQADELTAIRGIGAWTQAMVALRGEGQPDSLPGGDLGLIRAWQALAPDTLPLLQAAEHWRPWRSYAANLLWRSLTL